MDLWGLIHELWESESEQTVHGWIPDGNIRPVPPADPTGDFYMQAICADFGLRMDVEKMRDRAPVFVSQVEWPYEDGRVAVTKTLGPASFESLGKGHFKVMVHNGVALTDFQPMNGSGVDVSAALLSSPQSSLLDRAVDFIDDLSELTQVPQLTAAAPVARKIASGVDNLLGNKETEPLIAFKTTVSASRPRSGYYLVTTKPADSGTALDHFSVQGSRLHMWENDEWVPAAGFDFLLLGISLHGSQPKRWKSMTDIQDLWKAAIEQIGEATTKNDMQDAGRAALVAMNKVLFEVNLTVEDRQVAQAAMEKEWKKAVATRGRVIKSIQAKVELEAPPAPAKAKERIPQGDGVPVLRDDGSEAPRSWQAREVIDAGEEIGKQLKAYRRMSTRR